MAETKRSESPAEELGPHVEASQTSGTSPPSLDAEIPGRHVAPLLDASKVSCRLGVTDDFVYKLARDNEIPHVRLGRAVRFRGESVEDWIRSLERGTMAGIN